MRFVAIGVICLVVCTGAKCLELHLKKQPIQRTIADAPRGSIVGQCARDGVFIIIDTCSNCRAACDFKEAAGGHAFACNQCGQNYTAITCHRCRTNTHVSSGRFKLKE